MGPWSLLAVLAGGSAFKPRAPPVNEWGAPPLTPLAGRGVYRSSSQSAERISCSREAVRSNSKAPSPAG
jgi:hypothetical protein